MLKMSHLSLIKMIKSKIKLLIYPRKGQRKNTKPILVHKCLIKITGIFFRFFKTYEFVLPNINYLISTKTNLFFVLTEKKIKAILS